MRTTVYFKITVPADLIWGEISVACKYYEQSDDSYSLFYNGTPYTVWMTFYHTAVDEHFEIRATEGVMTSPDRVVVTTAKAISSNSTPRIGTITGEIRNNEDKIK